MSVGGDVEGHMDVCVTTTGRGMTCEVCNSLVCRAFSRTSGRTRLPAVQLLHGVDRPGFESGLRYLGQLLPFRFKNYERKLRRIDTTGRGCG